MEVNYIEIQFKGSLENKKITTTVLLNLGKSVKLGSDEYKEEYRKLNLYFAKLNEI